MAKLTLLDVSSGYGATTQINANADATMAAMENTLSRDGTAPNQMEANLDMNSNRILNLLDAVNASEPVTLGQAGELLDITVATQAGIGALLYPITDAETAAGVTPGQYWPSPWRGVDIRRFVANFDPATDTVAAMTIANTLGCSVYLPNLAANYVIDADHTLAVSIHTEQGAIISVSDTKTLTFGAGATLHAGRYQVFELNTSGAVSLRAGNACAYPEWFEGIDGVSDQVAFNHAFDAHDVVEMAGQYTINGTIGIGDFQSLISAQRRWSTITCNSGSSWGIEVTGASSGSRATGVFIGGFTLLEGATPSKGLHVKWASLFTCERVRITGFTGNSNCQIDEVWDSWFNETYFQQCGSSYPSLVIHYGGGSDNTNNIRFNGCTWEENDYCDIQYVAGTGANVIYSISYLACKWENSSYAAGAAIIQSAGLVQNQNFYGPQIAMPGTANTAGFYDCSGAAITRGFNIHGGQLTHYGTGTIPFIMRFRNSKELFVFGLKTNDAGTLTKNFDVDSTCDVYGSIGYTRNLGRSNPWSQAPVVQTFASYMQPDVNATTGSASASFTATNKPGSNAKTSPDTWMPVTLNGVTHYVPAFLP